jgi:hypothetical protein
MEKSENVTMHHTMTFPMLRILLDNPPILLLLAVLTFGIPGIIELSALAAGACKPQRNVPRE